MLATVSAKDVGGSGTAAALEVIEISVLKVLFPTLLIVATLNLQVVLGVNPVLVKDVAV